MWINCLFCEFQLEFKVLTIIDNSIQVEIKSIWILVSLTLSSNYINLLFDFKILDLPLKLVMLGHVYTVGLMLTVTLMYTMDMGNTKQQPDFKQRHFYRKDLVFKVKEITL